MKVVTDIFQSKILGHWLHPDTADMYRNPAGEYEVIPSNMKGSQLLARFVKNSQLLGHLAWSLDALVEYLCDSDDVYVEFKKHNGMWICRYTKYEGELKKCCSKMAPTKIAAIFEVIYQLHREDGKA